MARGMITVESTGNFRKTENFLGFAKKMNARSILEKYGDKGVKLLADATPVDSGVTAASWSYEIVERPGHMSIIWKNSSSGGNIPVVILIRYGHATRNGGYVEGNDFMTPVVNKIFKEMADTIWKEVTKK